MLVKRASNVVSVASVVVVVVVVVVGSLQHLCAGFLLQLMILHTGDFPLPNLGRCLVGRGLGRGRGVVCQVGRGRRRADRLGTPELFGVAGEVGGVLREGRAGRRVLWVVPSPPSSDDPPLRSGGRCGMDFRVGRTCQKEQKLWIGIIKSS